jgi:hypothetical protein
VSPDDDPIADALLGESTYERERIRAFGWFKQSIPTKLAWQSYLLFLLAAVLPVAAVLPRPVREAYFAEVAAASPKVAFLGFVAVVLVFGTGLGHAVVALRRLALEPGLTEVQARDLVSLENVCSLLGFFTGGVATALTYLLLFVGFGGTAALEAFVAAGGGNPYVASGLGVDVGTVAVTAVVGAVLMQFLSAYVQVRVVHAGLATSGAAGLR